jgi:hypothetical protein
MRPGWIIVSVLGFGAMCAAVGYVAHKCPECGTSTPIDRSAAIADSLTIVDLEAALVRRDSLDRVKDSIIANREPVYIRLDNGIRSLTLAPDDSIGAILDGKPVSKY